MKYDVAIIGCSTSGLYAAELLAGAGLTVGVFERRETLDPARRTLIVTPALLRVLGPLPEEATLHRVQFMDVEAGGEEARIEFEDPDLIVERSYLIRHWADRARQAGAEIHFGMRFESFAENGSGPALLFRGNGSQRAVAHASTVIGADGFNSRVARSSGLALPPHVPIVQAEVDLPAGWDPAATRVWFDVGRTRFFYWLIPESDRRGVVGLVGDSRNRARPLLDEFLAGLGLEPLGYQSARVALFHPRLKQHTHIAGARVFLVGDAAGQVKVSTVGGTVTGLWGAKAVVDHILTGSPLKRQLRGLMRELNAHWYLRFLLQRIGDRGYRRLVRDMNPSIRAVLAKHDRDSLSGSVWKLPFSQPRLLPLALRALVFPSRDGHAKRRRPERSSAGTA